MEGIAQTIEGSAVESEAELSFYTDALIFDRELEWAKSERTEHATLQLQK